MKHKNIQIQTGKPQGNKTTTTTTLDWASPDKSKLKPLK
jgi:hypothetical protein